MTTMILCLLVGIVIGVNFKLIKLPVPVPHDFSGIVGLMGMFFGSWLADQILKMIAK